MINNSKERRNCFQAIKENPKNIYKYLNFNNDIQIMKKVLGKDASLYSIISPSIASNVELAKLAMRMPDKNYPLLIDDLKNNEEIIRLFINNSIIYSGFTPEILHMLPDKVLYSNVSLYTICKALDYDIAKIKKALNSLVDFNDYSPFIHSNNLEDEIVLLSCFNNCPYLLLQFKPDLFSEEFIINILVNNKELSLDIINETNNYSDGNTMQNYWYTKVIEMLTKKENLTKFVVLIPESITKLYSTIELFDEEIIELCILNPIIYRYIPDEIKEDGHLLEQINNIYYK